MSRYKYAGDSDLAFKTGQPFEDLFDAVLGAQVARELGYDMDTSLTLSHGLGATSFVNHENKPFQVVGILEPTGTPVDRSVFVSLPAIEAIHVGWKNGTPTPTSRMMTPERLRDLNLQPESITALFVGATSRIQTLRLQRDLNTYAQEPLQAVIPGVALSQLWGTVSISALNALPGLTDLYVIIALTVISALLGLIPALVALKRSVSDGLSIRI